MQAAYAAEYRRLWDEHWWWRSRRRFVCGLLETLSLPSNANVLDIGCGDALFFDDLARYGQVSGIEPDINLIDESNPHRASITVAPFGPDYATDLRYDLITMLDVLEHIEDDRGTLHNVHEMLNPGGVAILTVPAFNWLWSMHDVANRHYRRYTRRELTGKLREQGFALDRAGYTFGWTVAAMTIRRLMMPAHDQSPKRERVNSGGAGVPPADESTDPDAYRVTPPPASVNAALDTLTRAEQAIARLLPLPLGSSTYAVARRVG